jgi:threonine dehydrogenase-like Zn-dependent dehydrogenase
LHASDSDVWRARCARGNNITIAGGAAPIRAYVEQLLPDVLDGRIEPGRVFDRVTNIDGVPDWYRAMNRREAIKVNDRVLSENPR